MWLENDKCREVVESGWGYEGLSYSFEERTKSCGTLLMDWSERVFGDIRKKIKEAKEKLEGLQTATQSEEVIKEIKETEITLAELLKFEEIKWFQRSRALWLKDGDRNTKFFHQKANQRKQRNTILRIKDTSGEWVKEEKEVGVIFRNFFVDLFKSDGLCNMREVIDSVEPQVTDDMNHMLTSPYINGEIGKALKQMYPAKASGPDGMPPLFFQKFWPVVESSFTCACLNILNNQHDPTPLNHNFIVLIPKVKSLETPKDFRPISLCNIIFRVITKAIANRLKSVLDQIISPQQSAFIPNRLITDNAMIAFETFHFMKNKKLGKKGFAALKLDMSKAYDRVEWNFLRAMCCKLGFVDSWIDFIMRCVTTVSYSILVNGQPCWEDKWIKKMTIEKPQINHRHHTEIEKVADLIDPNTCTWKETLVRTCFQREDAEAILATPLSERRPHDRMVWNNFKNGKFSVKFAYYLAINSFSMMGNGIPSPSTANRSWKKLWRINIPPSTRHFLWRACMDALPTKAGLRKRGMNIDPTCAICGEGNEAITHILFECPMAIHTWGLLPIRIDFQAARRLKFKNFCWNMVDSLPEEGTTLFVAIIWNLWMARNKFYFEEAPPEPQLIASRALRLSSECAQPHRSTRNQGPKRTSNSNWTKPPPGRLKLNSDAAVFRDGTVGYGFAVQDENGEVVVAGAKREKLIGSCEFFEAMALRFGLSVSLQGGLSNLMMETDSEIVVRAIKRDSDVDPYTMLIIEDIKKLMDRSQTTKVTWLHRNANQVAHALAHFGDEEGFEEIWVEGVSHCCNNFVVKDVGRESNFSNE